jgi:hypothetical protein
MCACFSVWCGVNVQPALVCHPSPHHPTTLLTPAPSTPYGVCLCCFYWAAIPSAKESAPVQICALIAYWMTKHFERTDAPKRAETLAAAEWLFGVVALDCGAGVATGRPDTGVCPGCRAGLGSPWVGVGWDSDLPRGRCSLLARRGS